MIRKTIIGRCGNCICYEECNMKALFITTVFGGRQIQIFEFVKFFLVETGGKFLVRIFTENKRKKDVKHFAISKLCASRPSEGSYRVLFL